MHRTTDKPPAPTSQIKRDIEDMMLQLESWSVAEALASFPGTPSQIRQTLRDFVDAGAAESDNDRIWIKSGRRAVLMRSPSRREDFPIFGRQGRAASARDRAGCSALKDGLLAFSLGENGSSLWIHDTFEERVELHRNHIGVGPPSVVGCYSLGDADQHLLLGLDDEQRETLLLVGLAHHERIARGRWRAAQLVDFTDRRSLWHWASATPLVGTHGCRGQWEHCDVCFHHRALAAASKFLAHGPPIQLVAIHPPARGMPSNELRQRIRDALNCLAAHGLGPTHAMVVPSMISLTKGTPSPLHAHVLLGGSPATIRHLESACRAFGLRTSGIERIEAHAVDQAKSMHYALAQTLTDNTLTANHPRAEIWTPQPSRMRRVRSRYRPNATTQIGIRKA